MSHETSPQIPEQTPEQTLSTVQQDVAVGWRAKLGRIAGASLLVAGSTLGFLSIDETVSPTVAHADTIDDALASYPDKGDTCQPSDTISPAQNPTAASPYVSCRYYDWGVPTSGGGFRLYSGRGYGYRNCTDWAAFRVNEASGGTISVPSNLGNAKDWYSNSPASEQSLTPKAGDVAVSTNGTYGHVAFVESVSADGQNMTISEYNYDMDGHGDQRTISTSNSEFSEFINYGIQVSGGGGTSGNTGPDSTQVFVNHAGEVWARSGVGVDWIREANAGSAAKVASGGGVQALIDDAGEVWARSGIGTDWTPESNQYSATEISVGSDGTQMIESYDGSVYAKRGVNWGGWVPEANPGSAADIATNGGLQVIRDNAGQLWVKGNSLDWGGFWPETGQYSALQVAVSNDGTQVLKSYDGSVYGRANTAGSNWVIEANPGSAAEVAIGNGVQMLVDGAGQVWQKGPSVDFGGWAAETNPGSAKNIAVVEDGTQLIQDNADQLWARSTAANSTFVWETSPGVIASLGQ